MADKLEKVVITIEDNPDGTCRVTSTPSFSQMMGLSQNGNKLTIAHGYALCALLAIRQRSIEMDKMNSGLIQIPKAASTLIS